MATVRSQEPICRIVNDRILKLETEAGHIPDHTGIVVSEDTLLAVDYNARNLQLYSSHDGKLLSKSHRLDSAPTGVCLISKTEVAVSLSNSEIVIMSFQSVNDVKLVKTLDVSTQFDNCHSIAKVESSDKLVVSGWKDLTLYWCVVSLTDGLADPLHKICTGGRRVHLVIKVNTIYISCRTPESNVQGVYAYDIFNPNERKFLYQDPGFNPWSITVDRRHFIYVCDLDSHTIHQLTDSGQRVTIHKVSSRLREIFYDDQHDVLYTTSKGSKVITVYSLEYLHQPGVPIEILNMDERSIQLFEEALKDGRETVHSIRVMVVGHMSVGKTTLVKRLLGKEVNISERCSTEGIDVYVNCCDVSLSTHEWIRRTKDSEQDYNLQRLVRVLNENYQSDGRVVDFEPDASSNQRERTDGNPMSHVADDDKNTEVLYRRSQQQNFGQNISSTSSLQKESPSTVFQSSLAQSETNTMPGSELGENVATESHKTEPLREMIKLLQQNPNKAKQNTSKYAYLSVFDFAGQFAFYTTHQLFLTRRAIYLLVSDASREVSDLVEDECYFDSEGIMKCKVHDLVEIWMNSIHSCASPDKENLNSANSHTSSYKVIPPPVILVGTHIDQIPQYYRRERGQRYLKDIRSYLRNKPTIVHLVDEDFAIDNTVVDSKLEELKRKIVEVASQQPHWGEQIPTRWFLLEQQLMRLRDAGVKVISHSAVEDLNKKANVQIKEIEELDLFLRYLHETGTVIYFSIEVLRENIVLDPKWLIDALKLLINAQPSLPNEEADNGPQSVGPSDGTSDRAVTQNLLDFKEKGILTLELVEAVWTQAKYPELHAHRIHILSIMEQLNIIAKPRAFTETGEKVENYFLVPCMLHQKSPPEVISPEEAPQIVSTLGLCCVFTGKFLPPPIFHRLLAACVAHWPVAQNRKTKENLIFCGCCVFDLDLFHRLTLHYRNHFVFARITRMVIDDVKTPDVKLCGRVRRFITLNLSKIISYLGQNLQYALRIQSPPSQGVPEARMFQMWFEDEGHDPDAPITSEHMNHARLCVALQSVCGKALRDILVANFPVPYKDIYQAILANHGILTRRQGKSLLNSDQCQLVFPDPQGQKTGTVDQFDLSLLYTLIRNISTVPAPLSGWGNDPQDQPRDSSLGASVERIRSYRNHIVGHSMDGKMNQQDFVDYWKKFEAVIHDIEAVTGGQVYSQELGRQKRQVISIYEAC